MKYEWCTEFGALRDVSDGTVTALHFLLPWSRWVCPVSATECWQGVSCNAAPLFLGGKLGPVCHSSNLSASSLAQKSPGEVRDRSSPWGLQQMFNAAKANLFVNLTKSSWVFLLFQILATLMCIKHLGWSVSQRLFHGNISLGSLLKERERGRDFFWSSFLKNNP